MALRRKNIGNNEAIGTFDTSYPACAAGLLFIARAGIDSLLVSPDKVIENCQRQFLVAGKI